MSIFEYNGGSIVAMAGKNCVAMACDRRLGAQMQTLATNFQRVFKMQDNILLGLSGLATDISTFYSLLEFKLNMYRLRENRPMKPSTFANLVSTSLYEKRFGPFFVTPIVAGLENGKVILASYDSIGCISIDYFAVGGTANDYLLGCCESFYKDNMEPEELEEVLSQTLVSALDRDALSGWGGIVYTMTPEKISIKVLKTKQT